MVTAIFLTTNPSVTGQIKPMMHAKYDLIPLKRYLVELNLLHLHYVVICPVDLSIVPLVLQGKCKMIWFYGRPFDSWGAQWVRL